MIRRFLNDLTEFDTDSSLIDRTIYVRRKYALKIPDAIIVATAIEKDLVLITAGEPPCIPPV